MRPPLYALALFILSAASVSAQDKSRRYALLVGVETYADKDALPNLPLTRNDMEELAKTLRDGPHPYEEVVMMTCRLGEEKNYLRPTRNGILIQLEQMADKCQKGDVLLFAFAGHGMQRKNGKPFLCCQQADLKDEKTLLPLDEVYAKLRRCGASLKVVAIGSCRTTAGGRAPLPVRRESDYVPIPVGTETSPGIVTLFSCKPGERSWEADGHGIFFKHFIAGLRGAAAGEGSVYVGKLADVIVNRVREESKKLGTPQNPHIVGDYSSDIPLVLLTRTFFEDFAEAKLAGLPKGWKGSLEVQKAGGQNVLQQTKILTGTVQLPPLHFSKDFSLECRFKTNGYVNRQTGLGFALEILGRAAIRVDLIGASRLHIVINGTQIRVPSVSSRKTNVLHLERSGDSFSVKLNGEEIRSVKVDPGTLTGLRVSLSNNRDEYGRVISDRLPTIESIRVSPVNP